jgi:hypothetical protein
VESVLIAPPVFEDYRPGDLVHVREPDGTEFDGVVASACPPWGMLVKTSYGRTVPCSFRVVSMVEPSSAHPLLGRSACGEPWRRPQVQ